MTVVSGFADISRLQLTAVIATGAMISLGTGLLKISVFGLAGAVTAQAPLC